MNNDVSVVHLLKNRTMTTYTSLQGLRLKISIITRAGKCWLCGWRQDAVSLISKTAGRLDNAHFHWNYKKTNTTLDLTRCTCFSYSEYLYAIPLTEQGPFHQEIKKVVPTK